MSNLLVIVQLPGFEPAPGKIRLTEKFVDGLRWYAESWPGPVHVIMPPGTQETGNLDDVVLDRSALPFTVHLLALNSAGMHERVAEASLVLGVPDALLAHTPRYCKSLGIPYVLNLEYSLLTRWQIAFAEESRWLPRMKRCVWEVLDEGRLLWQVVHATALQCNGVPTFNWYRRLNRDALLYFDSRIMPDMLAKEAQVRAKYRTNISRPLHLAFSGRLTVMKGADYLIPLARELRDLDVNFRFSILGAGDMEQTLQEQIANEGLGEWVDLQGVLDFKTQWIPFVTERVDLLVCSHPQGDPSCTYLETFACGVPIVGFANEAFVGLSRLARTGWVVPNRQVGAMAKQVQALAERPEQLEEAGLDALRFATKHTFDVAFHSRIAHMRRLTKDASTRSKAAS